MNVLGGINYSWACMTSESYCIIVDAGFPHEGLQAESSRACLIGQFCYTRFLHFFATVSLATSTHSEDNVAIPPA